MKNADQPAFTVSKEMCETSKIEEYPFGLTKLEYISAHILSGLCANSKLTQNTIDTVSIAVNMAELLLRKTNKE